MRSAGDASRRAYAKVNLALAVGPAIPAGEPGAGYHPIASWMHAIDLFDEVTAERLPGGSASRHVTAWAPDAPRPTPIDWPGARDLVARAHGALESAAGHALPAALTLTKRVPVAGGLGGGSSDAAATLALLNDLFALGLGRDRLAAIGHGLGSDVPFFLDDGSGPPRSALVSGLGDRVERAARADAELLLLLPPFGCATGAVYAAFDALRGGVGFDARAEEARRLVRAGSLRGAGLFNDLLPAAERVEPRLGEVRRRAEAIAGAPVRLSGSGSTLFLAATEGSGPGLAAKLRAELADVQVARARLV